MFEFNTAAKISEVAEKNAKAIEQININTTRHTEALSQAGLLISQLQPKLQKLGLEISQVGTSKSGNTPNWDETTILNVSLTCVPSEKSKFKFIPHNGYKADGSGQNESRLEAKKNKIEAALGYDKLTVNQYSLETGRRPKTDRVLITFYV